MIRLLASLTLFIICCARLMAQEDGELSQWVDAQKKLGDMQVSFQMTRTLPTLKEPTVSGGQLFRLKDGRFRMEMGQPPSTLMLFDGKEMHIWDGAKNQWHSVPPSHSAARMWTMFLHQDQLGTDSLTKDFSSVVTRQNATTSLITLQPKSSSLRRHLRQVDLQVQVPSQRLLQMRMTQSDGSTVTMTFDSPADITAAEQSKLSFTPSAKP